MSKQTSQLSWQLALLLAENTKMSTRSTESSQQRGNLRKQIACLLAENTKMNVRSTETRKQTGKLRWQSGDLLIESLVQSDYRFGNKRSFMRRDSIFYRIFKQSPALLFELLETPPVNAADYKFDSVAVKEPKFEIDGVFLPPDAGDPAVVYFCEVQFQRDEQLYERLFGEAFLYFYRNRSRYSDWQAVVLYPSRTVEQTDAHPYRALLSSNQVHRVYLDEVGEIRQLPLGIALMVLTTVDEAQAPGEARYLLARSRQAGQSATVSRAIMEMVTTIMVYKFGQMSRVEVEAMLGLTLQETRVYQEAKAEGEQIGEQRGEQRGRQQEAVRLLLKLLTRRLNQELSAEVRSRLEALPLTQLEALTETLLDFTRLDDLLNWLEVNQPSEGDRASEVRDQQ